MFNHSKRQDPFQEKIKQILEHDNKEELQNLILINRSSVLNYIDSVNNYDICQLAVQAGALLSLQYLLELVSLERHQKLDHEGNTLLHLAARAEKLEVFTCLMNFLPSGVRRRLNKNGESVLDFVQKTGNQKFLALFYQLNDPRTLDILPCGLSQASFLDKDDVGVKGLVILLHHYAQKNLNAPEVFFVRDLEENGMMLAKIFDLFVRSNNDSLLLYHDDDHHRLAYKCEKFEGKSYIFVLDSLKGWDDQEKVVGMMKEHYPESLAQLVFFVNQTVQQTAGSGCRHYSLKNISLWMKTPGFYEELRDGKHVTKIKINKGVEVRGFFLPARFMHLTTSPNQLANYLKKYPQEAIKIVRITKEGIPQDLVKYCHHSRNRFGIQTPRRIKNKNFDPSKEESKEEEFIEQNNSLYYFRNKYVHHVIPSLFNKLSNLALTNLLIYYDARHLMLDPQNNRICNQQIWREVAMDGQQNTYSFLPRRPASPAAAQPSLEEEGSSAPIKKEAA